HVLCPHMCFESAAKCGRNMILIIFYEENGATQAPQTSKSACSPSGCSTSRRPAVVQRRHYLRAACAFFFLQQRGWDRGPCRSHAETGLSSRLGRDGALAVAVLPLAT